MNISNLVTSVLPGAASGVSIAGAQGENSQETSLLEAFSEIFAVATPALEEIPAELPEQSPEAEGGSDMPESTGKNLPDVALAPLPPQANVADLPVPAVPDSDKVAESTRHAAAHLPGPSAEPTSEPKSESPKPANPAPVMPGTARTPVQNLAEPQQANGNRSPVEQTGTTSLAPRPVTFSAEPTPREMPVDPMLRSMPKATTPVANGAPEDAAADLSSPRQAPTQSSSTVQNSTPVQLQATTPSTPIAFGSDLAQAAGLAARMEAPSAVAPQRHDFTQVVERLAEARELAQPGRAEMQLTHREFGAISMQFQIAGSALKVVLANAHTGFAPAVQAALADQQITAPGEVLRTEAQPLQAVSQSNATSGQSTNHGGGNSSSQPHAGPQGHAAQSGNHASTSGQTPGDGQQNQGDSPRSQRVQSQPGEPDEQREVDGERRSTSSRETALFA